LIKEYIGRIKLANPNVRLLEKNRESGLLSVQMVIVDVEEHGDAIKSACQLMMAEMGIKEEEMQILFSRIPQQVD